MTVHPNIGARVAWVVCIAAVVLLATAVLGLAAGSSGIHLSALLSAFSGTASSDLQSDIIWKLRFPRVLLAALLGATLSLGGMVFQALLRNPLAEPYILGISGGSAIGAISGILLGLSRFPGVWLAAFAGSMATLGVLYLMASGRSMLRGNALLLSGVMVNAFCSAVILFLVSMAQDSRLHNIIFWLMGDLAAATMENVTALSFIVMPCFVFIMLWSNSLNLLTLGNDMAQSMGVNIRVTTIVLLVLTSLMVSATVSYCGLVGFVGLVIPHLLRMLMGPDHRVMAPAAVFGGAAFMVVCDTLARTLPAQGELPVGVITALIGAPLFVYLLRKSNH